MRKLLEPPTFLVKFLKCAKNVFLKTVVRQKLKFIFLEVILIQSCITKLKAPLYTERKTVFLQEYPCLFGLGINKQMARSYAYCGAPRV